MKKQQLKNLPLPLFAKEGGIFPLFKRGLPAGRQGCRGITNNYFLIVDLPG